MPNRQMAVDTFFGCSSGQMFIIAKERLLRPDRPLRRIRARERRPHRPYLAGREIATPPALPLGLVPDQTYDLVQGRLAPGE